MTVHVGEMTSEVTAEAEPASQTPASSEVMGWKQMESVCEAQARLAADRRRTAAEGYDD